jgi:anti-sigma B factor antagonist
MVDIPSGQGSNFEISVFEPFSITIINALQEQNKMAEVQVNLNISKQGKVNIVKFEDRKIIEELMINQIGERLSEIAESEDEPRILLDFVNVEHLSSAALGMLIQLNKRIAERNGKLALVNIRPQIFEVFKITRLNKLFNIAKNRDDAIQSLN